MKRLLILVALCTFATAMVPRLRRAINEEQTSSTHTTICLPTTPCGWIFYKSHPDQVDSTKDNTDYCQCASNMVCEVDEDDQTGKSLIKRCKLQSEASSSLS